MKRRIISMIVVIVLTLSLSVSAFADSPKYKSTQAYVNILEEYEVEYTYQMGEQNDEIINFTDAGDHRNIIDIDAQFIDSEDEMTLYAFDIISFTSDKYADVLEAVNKLNMFRNYACFSVTEDGVNATWDVSLGTVDANYIAEEALLAFFNTVDEAYSELAKFEN